MKKILLASTVLVATAGMAAAEITWGGFGRFGLQYNDNAGNLHDTIIDYRLRLTVTGIAESDNGLKFEGRMRWQADDNGFQAPNSGTSINGGASGIGAAGFAVTSGGFRLDVGSVSDVLDSGDVLNYYGFGVGYTSFLEQNNAFNGFDAAGFGNAADSQHTIKGRYTAGGFTGSASYTLNDSASTASEYWQIGGGYSFGDHRVGAMYGDNDGTGSYWVLGVDGSFGDFSYAVIVGDADNSNAAGQDVSFGASGSYAVSAATSLLANFSTGGAAANDTSWGLGIRHSLGGGVTLGAGIGQNVSGDTLGDAGVIFNF